MNLFQLLSNDNRVIVLSDEQNSQVYTWDAASPYMQVWDERNGRFVEAEYRTLDRVPSTFTEAKALARKWRDET
jgi:hypothetical protein